MKPTAVGIDIAKEVFQVHYVDVRTGEIVNRQIKRAKLLDFFANRAECLIGMEACGGSHHWARQLISLGHQVKLLPAKFVKVIPRNFTANGQKSAIFHVVYDGLCKFVGLFRESLTSTI